VLRPDGVTEKNIYKALKEKNPLSWSLPALTTQEKRPVSTFDGTVILSKKGGATPMPRISQFFV